jgi:hypothetical protein
MANEQKQKIYIKTKKYMDSNSKLSKNCKEFSILKFHRITHGKKRQAKQGIKFAHRIPILNAQNYSKTLSNHS